MSETSPPQKLDYDRSPRSRLDRFGEFVYKNRLRVAAAFLIICFVSFVLHRGLFYQSLTFYDLNTYTATRHTRVGVGGHVLWSWSKPDTFIYADVALPTDQVLAGFADVSLLPYPTEHTRWVFALPRRQLVDGLLITCAHGMRPPLDARSTAFDVVKRHFPNATQPQRFEIFRRLAETLRPYHGSRDYSILNDLPRLVEDASSSVLSEGSIARD